ncbi:MAG: arylsulfatase A-like enzyme/cytochrome c-type biogenesis protein CcmH/NrfG [Planctomycetota bacterium]|jgi:arylsulfatase A-like enzyme/cytochrome c-type biogenesis protein CcmH/NrfG
MNRQSLAALLLCPLLGCGDAAEPVESLEGRPNVLLITLDTVRADRLGCYGWEAAETPAIDALAKDGALFANAYSHVPFTMPSHSTMLTGLHPSGHGLHVNYTGVLGEELLYLPDILQGKGYRTSAFIAARVLHDEFGLGRGFDHYSNVPEGGKTEYEQVQRPGDTVCDEAIAWIRSAPNRPFFSWVHMFDAHEPRMTPPGFEGVGSDVYDSEIAFCDAQVARLLSCLDELGLRENTLVIITSDHGEGLGQHDERDHGLLVYDTTLRVPLILNWPDSIQPGSQIADLAGLVDLTPTILGQLGWNAASKLEGRDLSPLLMGESMASQPLVFESEYAARTLRWAPLRGLISYPWKFIEAPTPELYNLSTDPGELVNLAELEAERLQRMRSSLASARDQLGKRRASLIVKDDALDKELQDLGYLGGDDESTVDAEEIASLRDPKHSIEIFEDVRRAQELRDKKDHAVLLPLAKSLVSRSPESPSMWSLLGETHIEAKQWAEAEQAWSKCLELKPDVAWRIGMLADSIREQGRVADALVLYRRALDLEPTLGQMHSRVGTIHAQRGEIPLALASFKSFAELEPKSANAHTNLANALLSSGQMEQGIRSLERALDCDPACLPALRTMSEALRAAKRHPEAVRTLREAIALVPKDISFQSKLAWLLSVSSDPSVRSPEEGLRLAEQCLAAQAGNPLLLQTLAAAQAANAKYNEAVASAERAIDLAQGKLPARSIDQIRAQLDVYRQGQAIAE